MANQLLPLKSRIWLSYSVWPQSEHNVHIFFCLSENRRHDKNLIISSHKEPKSSGLSCFYSLSHVLKILERWKRFYNLGLYFSKIIILERSSFYVICLTSSYHQSLFIDIINFIIEFIIWNQKRKLILFKGKQFVLQNQRENRGQKMFDFGGKTGRRNWNAETARGGWGWGSICLDMIMIVPLNISFKPLGAACQWCQSVSVNSVLILLGQHNNITSGIIASNHGTSPVHPTQGWRRPRYLLSLKSSVTKAPSREDSFELGLSVQGTKNCKNREELSQKENPKMLPTSLSQKNIAFEWIFW